MGVFKRRKAVSFQIGLCSDPHLWSWILGNDRKNIISGASGRDGTFAKRPRCDTGRTKVRWRSEQETSLARPSLNLRSFGSKCTVLKKKLATFWDFSAPPVIRSPGQFACLAPLVTPLVRHFAKACAAVKFTKPWMSNHFSELRDHSCVSSTVCPECPTKSWRDASCWLNPRESGSEVVKGQVECLHLWPCLVPSWCGASKTNWNCCWPWDFQLLLRLLTPRTSLMEKRAWKWMKWMPFTLFSLFTGV